MERSSLGATSCAEQGRRNDGGRSEREQGRRNSNDFEEDFNCFRDLEGQDKPAECFDGQAQGHQNPSEETGNQETPTENELSAQESSEAEEEFLPELRFEPVETAMWNGYVSFEKRVVEVD